MKAPEQPSELQLRLALPSEGLQLLLQEQLWQLLKALLKEFPVRHQVEVGGFHLDPPMAAQFCARWPWNPQL